MVNNFHLNIHEKGELFPRPRVSTEVKAKG